MQVLSVRKLKKGLQYSVYPSCEVRGFGGVVGRGGGTWKGGLCGGCNVPSLPPQPQSYRGAVSIAGAARRTRGRELHGFTCKSMRKTGAGVDCGGVTASATGAHAGG